MSAAVLAGSDSVGGSTARQRCLLVVVAILLTFAACVPAALTLPEHGDEAIYAWGGHYYLSKIVRLDFTASPAVSYQDPGWDPTTIWALTGPTMTRVYYGVVEVVTGIPLPTLAYEWTELTIRGKADPSQTGLDMHLKPGSLRTLRISAILAAAIGFGLFTYRLGRLGFLATVVMLLLPGVGGDLARAWAEGPLFLALGLCCLAFGTRWFGVSAGMALTFKLTAIGVWAFLLLPRASGTYRGARWIGIASAFATFTVLTPPSWYFGGPLYLLGMIFFRTGSYFTFSNKIRSIADYSAPSSEAANPLGLFLPTRYLLPIEWVISLIVAFGICWMIRLVQHRRTVLVETS